MKEKKREENGLSYIGQCETNFENGHDHDN